MNTCLIESPLGTLRAFAEDRSLRGLWFTQGQRNFPEDMGGSQETPDYPVFGALRAWLEDYFAGKNPPLSKVPPLAPQGTAFRQAVWDLLLQIPYGKTAAYGELAAQIALGQGIPVMAAQAIGGAVGHNPVSILIPCHRVVGAHGSLTGYGGGLDRKAALLALEQGKQGNPR